MMEDERYYVKCPKRQDKGKVPVVKCFDCEFSTGEVLNGEFAHVEIACGFPVGRIMKKTWSRPSKHWGHGRGKGSNRPRVNKIERDGLG